MKWISIFINILGVLADISYDGNVYINPPALIASSCAIDISDFPFDEQICEVKYGSWMRDIKYFNLISDKVYLNTFMSKNFFFFLILLLLLKWLWNSEHS